MNVLNNLSVFGGYGFVGSEFCRQNPDSIRIAKADYSTKSSDILYFISTVHNYHVYDNPYLDVQTNLSTLIDVLEGARDAYGEDVTFNFISSWFVYGKTECPAREDTQCNPTGFYSITKRCAEQLLISYCETFKMSYRILRLCNILGRGDYKISRKKNAFQYMVQQAAIGNDIDYLYEGDFYRDFMDVRDAARAIKLVIEKGNLNEIFNIGSGQPANINEMVYYTKEVAKSNSNISLIPVPEFHKTVQVKDMWLDISKLNSLGFKAKYALQDTIKDLVELYKEIYETKS